MAPLDQGIGRRVVSQEIEGIHDRYHGVELREIVERPPLLVREGEGLGDRQRLADPGALDDHLIETPFPGEGSHLLEQILPQSAADAPIAHLHQLLLRAVERCAAPFHQRGVDVHLAHIIDNERDTAVFAVVQDVVQQRRLARTKKPGEHCHRQWGPSVLRESGPKPVRFGIRHSDERSSMQRAHKPSAGRLE